MWDANKMPAIIDKLCHAMPSTKDVDQKNLDLLSQR